MPEPILTTSTLFLIGKGCLAKAALAKTAGTVGTAALKGSAAKAAVVKSGAAKVVTGNGLNLASFADIPSYTSPHAGAPVLSSKALAIWSALSIGAPLALGAVFAFGRKDK